MVVEPPVTFHFPDRVQDTGRHSDSGVSQPGPGSDKEVMQYSGWFDSQPSSVPLVGRLGECESFGKRFGRPKKSNSKFQYPILSI